MRSKVEPMKDVERVPLLQMRPKTADAIAPITAPSMSPV
jgi:hypothetical protein